MKQIIIYWYTQTYIYTSIMHNKYRMINIKSN